MEILAIILALVATFVVFKFIAGMVKFVLIKGSTRISFRTGVLEK